MSPLLAQSRHGRVHCTCPLLGVKRTSRFASITRAGIRREVLKFVRLALPLLRVSRGSLFDRDIRPSFRIICIKLQPLLRARFGIRLYCLNWAFWLAHAAVHTFALDATLVDDVGQLIFSFQQIGAPKSSTMFAIAVLALWLKVNAEKIRVLW